MNQRMELPVNLPDTTDLRGFPGSFPENSGQNASGQAGKGKTGQGPYRVQLSRKKGWRMPPNTVKVDRSTKHGNPFRVGDYGIPDAAAAKQRFREWREGRVVGPPLPPLDDIRGKNLACWCSLSGNCHADVLLELANAPPARPLCGSLGDEM